MMLVEWMSASSAADEWEVLSSHLQYLGCEISHITKWYLGATPLSEGLILKIQMGFLRPGASRPSLSFAACHCEANWKGFSFIKASVGVGSVTQLSYLLSGAGLQQSSPSSQSRPPFRFAPWLISGALQGGRIRPRVRRLRVVSELGPGASHLGLVNNTSWKACLQSPQQGQKASLNLSGCLSDVEQMCWNGGNYVTPFSSLSCDHDDWRALIRMMWLCGGTTYAVAVFSSAASPAIEQSQCSLNASRCPLQVHLGGIFFFFFFHSMQLLLSPRCHWWRAEDINGPHVDLKTHCDVLGNKIITDEFFRASSCKITKYHCTEVLVNTVFCFGFFFLKKNNKVLVWGIIKNVHCQR